MALPLSASMYYTKVIHSYHYADFSRMTFKRLAIGNRLSRQPLIALPPLPKLSAPFPNTQPPSKDRVRFRVDLPKDIYDTLNSESIKKRYNALDIGGVLREILLETGNMSLGKITMVGSSCRFFLLMDGNPCVDAVYSYLCVYM